jgi:hypothetical protein
MGEGTGLYNSSYLLCNHAALHEKLVTRIVDRFGYDLLRLSALANQNIGLMLSYGSIDPTSIEQASAIKENALRFGVNITGEDVRHQIFSGPYRSLRSRQILQLIDKGDHEETLDMLRDYARPMRFGGDQEQTEIWPIGKANLYPFDRLAAIAVWNDYALMLDRTVVLHTALRSQIAFSIGQSVFRQMEDLLADIDWTVDAIGDYFPEYIDQLARGFPKEFSKVRSKYKEISSDPARALLDQNLRPYSLAEMISSFQAGARNQDGAIELRKDRRLQYWHDYVGMSLFPSALISSNN